MKILCVEDGSVDVDNLENESKDGGLLVYRHGAEKPYVLEISSPDLCYKKMWEELKNKIVKSLPYTTSFKVENITRFIGEIENKYLGGNN